MITMMYSYLELNSALTSDVRIDRIGLEAISVSLIDKTGVTIDTETFPVNAQGELTPHSFNAAIGLIRGYRAIAEYNSVMARRLGVARVNTPIGMLVAYKTGNENAYDGIAVDLVKPDGRCGRIALIDAPAETDQCLDSPLCVFAFDGENAEPAVYQPCAVDGAMMQDRWEDQ